MRIALLTDLFYPYQLGGAEKQFFEIAKRLAKKHDVHVFTLKIHGCKKYEIYENIHIHRIGKSHSMKKRSFCSLASYFLESPLILKHLKKFDIIHANQASSVFVFLRLIINRPFIVTIHDIYANQWKQYYKFPLNELGKKMEILWSKAKYDRIITVSNSTRNKLKKFGFKSHIEVIPNGIDFRAIDSIKSKKKNHIVCISRLVKYKRVDEIIAAMENINKKYPALELHIIGSGEEQQNLEKRAKELNINVKFLGFIREAEKIKELKSALVFVTMSDVEGFGISLLEAMASGTPVIAKKLDCYKDFCNKKNSILIAKRELEKTLLLLLSNSKLRKSLQKDGIETAKRFDWSEIAKQTEELYGAVLKEHSLKNTKHNKTCRNIIIKTRQN